jgi:hypothetical protein
MNHFSPFRLQRMLLTLTLVLAAGWALALPSPKEIEAAVGAGQLPQAETMLREVLQAKPQSAKAHYELGQVLARQGKFFEAQQALDQAKIIDPTLKFATSPEAFAKTYDTVLAQVRGASSAASAKAAVATPAAPVASPAPASPAGGFNLMYVWMGAAGLVVLGLILRRRATAAPAVAPAAASAAATTAYAGMPPPVQPAYNGAAMATGGIIGSGLSPAQAAAPAQRGFGSQYAPQAPAHYPPAAAPAAGGMGAMGGAVMGGVAGLAAGYALSKAMEGGANHPNSAASSNAANPSNDSAGYVPFDNPSRPDMGAFDAGAGGDSWDVGQAPMDDDEW